MDFDTVGTNGLKRSVLAVCIISLLKTKKLYRGTKLPIRH